MVRIEPYRAKIPEITDTESAFQMFIDTLLSTNRTPSFFVDWEKVKEHVEENKVGISILNSLIHSNDRYGEIKTLLGQYSREILPVFPLIIAVREKKMDLVEKFEIGHLEIEEYDFSPRELGDVEIEKYADFCKAAGILSLFGEISDLRDYLLGVEVGMDTNARKNRGGKEMEGFVMRFLEHIAGTQSIEIEILSQATKRKIKKEWGLHVEFDKANRRFDFAVMNVINQKLFLIEVNFYNSGGSKLKSTAGEYKDLQKLLKKQDIDFIWITDGKGWEGTREQMNEAFVSNDYILNINFLNKGILEEILAGDR